MPPLPSPKRAPVELNSQGLIALRQPQRVVALAVGGACPSAARGRASRAHGALHARPSAIEVRIRVRWRADRRRLAGRGQALPVEGVATQRPAPSSPPAAISAVPSARFMASASAARPSPNRPTIWRFALRLLAQHWSRMTGARSTEEARRDRSIDGAGLDRLTLLVVAERHDPEAVAFLQAQPFECLPGPQQPPFIGH